MKLFIVPGFPFDRWQQLSKFKIPVPETTMDPAPQLPNQHGDAEMNSLLIICRQSDPQASFDSTA